MQKVFPPRSGPALLLYALLSVTACDVPERTYAPVDGPLSASSAHGLLSCPSSAELIGGGAVSPAGGTVTVGGNEVVVPLGAITDTVDIVIEEPASPYMLVELTADGQAHWRFLAPLVVTIDYSRCPIGPLDAPVTVYHVDSATGALLEHMGGTDDRSTRTITFTTDHFSGYAIAN